MALMEDSNGNPDTVAPASTMMASSPTRDEEVITIRDLFDELVTTYLPQCQASPQSSNNAVQLRLYGLFKRVTVGRLVATMSDAGAERTDSRIVRQSRPSGMLELKKRAKYDAWLKASEEYSGCHGDDDDTTLKNVGIFKHDEDAATDAATREYLRQAMPLLQQEVTFQIARKGSDNEKDNTHKHNHNNKLKMFLRQCEQMLLQDHINGSAASSSLTTTSASTVYSSLSTTSPSAAWEGQGGEDSSGSETAFSVAEKAGPNKTSGLFLEENSRRGAEKHDVRDHHERKELSSHLSVTMIASLVATCWHSTQSRIKVYPRGRLDISWHDLWFAFSQCLRYLFLGACTWRRPSSAKHATVEHQIEHLFSNAITSICPSSIRKDGNTSTGAISASINDNNNNNDNCYDGSPAPAHEHAHAHAVVVSLSVRTAFDLYLQAKNYPSGSEIIMTAIQIEGMVRVAQCHGLKVIPVDYTTTTTNTTTTSKSCDNGKESGSGALVAPSPDAIASLVTRHTVAVMIVHPFGSHVGFSSSDFQQLRVALEDKVKEEHNKEEHRPIQYKNNNTIEIWEDCAECYVGLTLPAYSNNGITPAPALAFQPYLGHATSDVVFFSFGTIKTCTALGGGVMILQSQSQSNTDNDSGGNINSTGSSSQKRTVTNSTTALLLVQRIQRLQQRYPVTSEAVFLQKVLKCGTLQLCATFPLLLGVLVHLCRIFGLDYDSLVTSSVKGFNINKRQNHHYDHQETRQLVGALRKRPSVANLALLQRRLQRYDGGKSVSQRIARCQRLIQQIISNSNSTPTQYKYNNNNSNGAHTQPSAIFPATTHSGGTWNCHWLLPIQMPPKVCPNIVSRELFEAGFDVPRGTSQLGCVEQYTDTDLLATSTTTTTRTRTTRPTQKAKRDNNCQLGMGYGCPVASKVMSKVLYLPVASYALPPEDQTRLVQTLVNSIHRQQQQQEEMDEHGPHHAAAVAGERRTTKADNITSNPLWRERALVMGVPVTLSFIWYRGIGFTLHLVLVRMAWSSITFLIKYLAIAAVAVLSFVTLVNRLFGPHYLKSGGAFVHGIAKPYGEYPDGLLEEEKEEEEKNAADSEDHKQWRNKEEQMTRQSTTGTSTAPAPSNLSTLFRMEDVVGLEFPPRVLGLIRNNREEVISKETKAASSSVLLTGGTGFVGSMMLRDLLLHRTKLGIPGGVVLLCRAKDGMSAAERIRAMLRDSEMFSFLSSPNEIDIDSIVTVIESDVSLPHLGMSDGDTQALASMNVTHVIHCAAAVSFVQPLEDAAASNITPALQLQTLANELWKAKYVHISTAFVHGGLAGTKAKPLGKELHALGDYDPYELYKSMVGTQAVASYAMQELGFPNSYTFSKCVCEHLLMQQREATMGTHRDSTSSFNTIILRPSIVGPSVVTPWPGWAGSKPSTLVAAGCFHLKHQWCLWSVGATQTPVIPVDVASRYMLCKAFLEPDACHQRCIHNVTWDRHSPTQSGFSWNEFMEASVKQGSVYGHYSRLTAILFHMINIVTVPSLQLSHSAFLFWHRMLVKTPLQILHQTLSYVAPSHAKPIKLLLKFIDLPTLFLHFSSSNYYFESDLMAPSTFDGARYVSLCSNAARTFISQMPAATKPKKRQSNEMGKKGPLTGYFTVAGQNKEHTSSDIWWALTQPRGNWIIRVAGYIIIKIFRRIAQDITVDIESLAALAKVADEEEKRTGMQPHMVLSPTHRSFLDFILLSFICFALPELGIPIPYICAAEEFQHLSLFGMLAKWAGAFFVKRGRGRADPSLTHELKKLKSRGAACFEVFIEGKRSRDRRFMAGKTGFLRCLQETGGNHIMLPVTISYERIPEQDNLAQSVGRQRGTVLSVAGLLRWVVAVAKGHVQLGRIHVAGACPVRLPSICAPAADLYRAVESTQLRQQKLVHVTSYHIQCGSKVLGVKPNTVRQVLTTLECLIWGEDEETQEKNSLLCPVNPCELWSIVLQWGHLLAPFVESLEWSLWLDPSTPSYRACPLSCPSQEVLEVACAFNQIFRAAEMQVERAVTTLESKGFASPNKQHILQYFDGEEFGLPLTVAIAAIQFVLKPSTILGGDDDDDSAEEKKDVDEYAYCKEQSTDFQKHSGTTPLFSSTAQNDPRAGSADDALELESVGAWGFKDSRFVMNMVGRKKVVTMKGNRYRISGNTLPNLIPFIEQEMGISVDIRESAFSTGLAEGVSIPASEIDDHGVKELHQIFKSRHDELSQVSVSTIDRIRHGTGHTQEDMFMLRSGKFRNARMPDAVVWPSTEAEVVDLVNLARQEDWCLIPFGGGTNVSHATWCPAKVVEPRPILSVDMKHMRSILDVNMEDGLIHVQAGITGLELVTEMKKRGLTIGHEPDSIEFSTLGGWVATKASGMKRNKYGNIEDIVKEVRVVGSSGTLAQHHDHSSSNKSIASAFGRGATGMDLTTLMMGSEGCLGIITSVIMKVWPFAERKEFECVVLPSFDVGLQFVRNISRHPALMPASVRLLDNAQFRLGQVLKPEATGTIERLKRTSAKAVAGLLRGFDERSVVGVTFMFEGSSVEVEMQQRHVKELATKHGGLLAGPSNGEAGYDLTFAIAYMRDFAMTYHCLGESFETFVPWSKLEDVIDGTKQRIREEHRHRYLPGTPFIASRVTQLYDEGVCVYFYFCMYFKNVQSPSTVFSEIEAAARQEILDRGGNLSHHHGIGKLRSSFMSSHVNPAPLNKVLQGVKKSFDPDNIFGARNGAFAER
jgi:alkyldihydroxyacetonephosphate synthase